MITQEILKENFVYKSGDLYWREETGQRSKKAPAGWTTKEGYRRVSLNSKDYQVSHLIWLWHKGELPSMQIDHKNGKRSDNRVTNLRLATPSQNSANRRKPSHNTSGLKGVSWASSRGKWRAGIHVDRKYKHLGYFTSKKVAHKAYKEAAQEHFGEFAR